MAFRSTQSRSPSATATANSEASVTPEPSKRPLSSTPTPSTTSTRLPSVLERPRSPPAGTSPATTIPPPLTTTSTTSATATTITTATTIGLKRPRSPSLIGNFNATNQPFFATAQEPPRKMSRFAGPTDSWQGQHPHHPAMQDRVVLPPLSTAVDNGLTPSRRPSMVSSPTSYTTTPQGGSYAFTNTFESQRPQQGSGSMPSPSMNNVNGDHGQHPYRRPSMAGRSQSTMINGRTPASPMSQDIHQAPRLTSAYSDPNTTTTASMSWNIPPPTNSSDRPNNATYSAYGDYSTGGSFDTSASMAGEGTPQSPSFAFTSNGFAAAAAAQPGMYTLNNTTARAAAHHHAHHQSFSLAAQLSASSQSTPTPSSASSSTLINSEQSQNHTPTPIEEELAQLRTKVRELEFVNDLVQLRVVELENEKSKLLGGSNGGSDKGSSTAGSPSSRSTSSTLVLNTEADPDFQSSWQKRTEARIKRFCSLNRAGNALCAWHDSRRERRAYPPRMAPPGTLNCGCTYEEALFEESLSRHKVGSYLPGEMVRMDPALRNPLLALLQWRYGYKDGDFERDPSNGRWVDGEGEHVWQQKASSGGSSSRRKQSDPEAT
ncbi:hypothetical protein FRC05_006223 [Tulasnella sp. 425]|nr:hypothetical protein FRC05_006223 [Tulasnella sp. 425]